MWLVKENKFSLNNVRDSKYLNWYCFNSIDNKLVFATEKNQFSSGYIICRLENNNLNLKILEIIDFYAIKDEENVFNSLIYNIIDFSKKIKLI